MLATSVGGVPFVVRDGFNGVLRPYQATQAFAEAWVQFYQDDTFYQHYYDNAQKTGLSWDWRTLAQQVYDIYQRAILDGAKP